MAAMAGRDSSERSGDMQHKNSAKGGLKSCLHEKKFTLVWYMSLSVSMFLFRKLSSKPSYLYLHHLHLQNTVFAIPGKDRRIIPLA